MLKVLGIGDNVCDVYVGTGLMYPGGQAYNFAVYAKQLGAQSSFMGVFGNDEVAAYNIKTLDEFQITHERCRQYDGENGHAMVKLIDGDRTFMGSNKGGVLKEHPIVLDEEDLAYIGTFDLVHTSNNSYFDEQLGKVSALGIPLSYDFSNKWTDMERTAYVSGLIDYGFISCGSSLPEEEILKTCEEMHKRGCGVIIATMGRKGALLYDGELKLFQKPDPEKAIDSLGAGDSFATAFLLHVAEAKKQFPERIKNDSSFREQTYIQAMKNGARMATKSCMVRGAFGHGTSIPDFIVQKIANL